MCCTQYECVMRNPSHIQSIPFWSPSREILRAQTLLSQSLEPGYVSTLHRACHNSSWSSTTFLLLSVSHASPYCKSILLIACLNSFWVFSRVLSRESRHHRGEVVPKSKYHGTDTTHKVKWGLDHKRQGNIKLILSRARARHRQSNLQIESQKTV